MQIGLLQTSFCPFQTDMEEGIIRWEFGRPYLIAHGEDGHCVHLDRIRTNSRCTCTAQSHAGGLICRNNEKWRVWVDYKNNILNSELMERIDRDNSGIYFMYKYK
jgi:hypothetical protein